MAHSMEVNIDDKTKQYVVYCKHCKAKVGEYHSEKAVYSNVGTFIKHKCETAKA